MKTGVFPGSFCPITVGHLNVIKRCAVLVDTLYVVVGDNSQKCYAISAEDRTRLVQKAVESIPNVKAVQYSGFMTDFCRSVDADVMFKSVRNEADLEDARLTKEVNEKFWKDGETVILLTEPEFEHVSSTLVRELVAFKKDISQYVPKGLEIEITKLLTM